VSGRYINDGERLSAIANMIECPILFR